MLAPRVQRQLIDLVDVLPALLQLAPHPVPVDVGADAVQNVRAELVLLPVTCVELENWLIHQLLAALEMTRHVS